MSKLLGIKNLGLHAFILIESEPVVHTKQIGFIKD